MKSRIAVLGYAGKMGFGIAELFMQTLPFQKDPGYQLILIDLMDSPSIRSKFKSSIRSFCEKNINRLRTLYANDPHLVSNKEIIDFFIEDLFNHVTFSTAQEEVRHAEWIFEAVFENIDLKISLFKSFHHLIAKEALVFSNTSAIPIHLLAKESGLNERLIGFHFYNPPTHNKMLEIVVPSNLRPFSELLAKELKRTYVHAGDFPGFIGNGHFIREMSFALDLVQSKKFSSIDLDDITENLLLRPLGIFKLARFIGIDTVIAIGTIMGIDCQGLKKLPEDPSPMKTHKIDPLLIPGHMKDLFKAGSKESLIAIEFLNRSKIIGESLVEMGIASSLKDVETVLKIGFHHPYGFEYANI